MSDRMPEGLPVTKCINVMVGITRSKVIIIYYLLLLFHIYIYRLLLYLYIHIYIINTYIPTIRPILSSPWNTPAGLPLIFPLKVWAFWFYRKLEISARTARTFATWTVRRSHGRTEKALRTFPVKLSPFYMEDHPLWDTPFNLGHDLPVFQERIGKAPIGWNRKHQSNIWMYIEKKGFVIYNLCIIHINWDAPSSIPRWIWNPKGQSPMKHRKVVNIASSDGSGAGG